MRVLMIGTGSIGRRHLANLRQLVPTAHFTVLREKGRSKESGGLGEVSLVHALDEALAAQPELMVISSPSALHLRYLVAAIDLGIPFYVEKPVVSDWPSMAVLRAKLLRARPASNLVGCNLRFLPSLVRLRSLVHEGRLGNVVHASFEAGQWLPGWRPGQDYRQSYSARRALGGGVILDLIHELDCARWILGDIVYLQAQSGRRSGLEIDTEDFACMLLRAANGVCASVQVDYVSRQPFRRYRVVGDRATAEWDLPSRSLTISDQDGVCRLELDAFEFDVGATYPSAMSELLKSIVEQRASSLPIEEGLRTLELALRAKHDSEVAA